MMHFTPGLQPTMPMSLESRILFIYATSFTIFFLLLCLLLALCLRLVWDRLRPNKTEVTRQRQDEDVPPPSFTEALRAMPRRSSEVFVLMEDDLPPPYNLAIVSK
jgi:hypothetical protein